MKLSWELAFGFDHPGVGRMIYVNIIINTLYSKGDAYVFNNNTRTELSEFIDNRVRGLSSEVRQAPEDVLAMRRILSVWNGLA
jgi:hypothetical protein